MLVRDDHDGMHVLMLRRPLDSVFVGGAYVFPGGAVDEGDRHADLEAVCEGRTDAEASEALGLEQGGLAFWVAAIRECFEEAGVLLAYDHTGEMVHLDEPATARRFNAHREAVYSGRRRLVDVCAAEGLRLAVDAVHYFSHWITPPGAPRRYDTRFFVGAAPHGQTPLYEEREAIGQCWVRPGDALARQRRREWELIFPTMRSLEAISRFDRSSDLLAAASAVRRTPASVPRLAPGGRGARIPLPGDPGYRAANDSAD
jgi:8-oxo-dGTP pyrophosphatase MutT (NUDIX family)